MIAKLAWGDYYQGELLDASNFGDGDQYERFNFSLSRGWFYGSIPGRVPRVRGGSWTVFFAARHPALGALTAIGWYKKAEFTEKTLRPEYGYIVGFDHSQKYQTGFKYIVKAPVSRLLRTEERLQYQLPNVGNRLGNAKFVYVRGPEAGPEPWRSVWAEFVDQAVR
jgi:hypothetical protein